MEDSEQKQGLSRRPAHGCFLYRKQGGKTHLMSRLDWIPESDMALDRGTSIAMLHITLPVFRTVVGLPSGPSHITALKVLAIVILGCRCMCARTGRLLVFSGSRTMYQVSRTFQAYRIGQRTGLDSPSPLLCSHRRNVDLWGHA